MEIKHSAESASLESAASPDLSFSLAAVHDFEPRVVTKANIREVIQEIAGHSPETGAALRRLHGEAENIVRANQDYSTGHLHRRAEIYLERAMARQGSFELAVEDAARHMDVPGVREVISAINSLITNPIPASGPKPH